MSAVKPTITACILARNEERRIEDAVRSLQGWTDGNLIVDKESEASPAGFSAHPGWQAPTGLWPCGDAAIVRTRFR